VSKFDRGTSPARKPERSGAKTERSALGGNGCPEFLLTDLSHRVGAIRWRGHSYLKGKSSRRLKASQSGVGRLLEDFPAEGARWASWMVDGAFVYDALLTDALLTDALLTLAPAWNRGSSSGCGKTHDP
jgi:hypothetical protein